MWPSRTWPTVLLRSRSGGRFFVGLEDAEDVAFGVLAVGKPSDTGHGVLRQRFLAARLGDRGQGRVEVGHADRVDKPVHRGGFLRRGALPRDEPAVDAGALTGADHPVGNATPALELPAEHGGVERDGPFGVARMDLEVDRTRHRSSPRPVDAWPRETTPAPGGRRRAELARLALSRRKCHFRRESARTRQSRGRSSIVRSASKSGKLAGAGAAWNAIAVGGSPAQRRTVAVAAAASAGTRLAIFEPWFPPGA